MKWTLGRLAVTLDAPDSLRARPTVHLSPRTREEFDELMRACGGLGAFEVDEHSTTIYGPLTVEGEEPKQGMTILGPHISVTVPEMVAGGRPQRPLPGMAELRRRQLEEQGR